MHVIFVFGNIRDDTTSETDATAKITPTYHQPYAATLLRSTFSPILYPTAKLW